MMVAPAGKNDYQTRKAGDESGKRVVIAKSTHRKQESYG